MSMNRTPAEWGALNVVATAQRQSRNVVKQVLVDANHDIAVLASREAELVDVLGDAKRDLLLWRAFYPDANDTETLEITGRIDAILADFCNQGGGE